MLISVHIPKSAGTTFRNLLQHHFGCRLYLDYGDRPLAPNYRWRMFKKRWQQGKNENATLSTYESVHGHFVAH